LGQWGRTAEDVAKVFLGVEPVEAGRGDEGQEVAGAGGMIVAADEEPGLAAHRDLPQLSLGCVVVGAKPAVVEEAHEGILLADHVAEGAPQKASLAPDMMVLLLGPREEGVDLGPTVLVAQALDLVGRLVTPPRLEVVQPADAVDGLASDCALGRDRRTPAVSTSSARPSAPPPRQHGSP
jgi:hypothetical protein